MAHILHYNNSEACIYGGRGAISPVIGTVEKLVAIVGVFNGEIARYTHTHDEASIYGDY